MRESRLAEQVRANLAKAEARPEFTGDRLWLTFYLSGPAQNLEKLSQALADEGCLNIEDWEGGFLYPKWEVERTAAAIIAVAEKALGLCDAHNVEVLGIDADTSPEVQTSRFVTLCNFAD